MKSEQLKSEMGSTIYKCQTSSDAYPKGKN